MISVSIICATIDKPQVIEASLLSIRRALEICTVDLQVIIVDQTSDFGAHSLEVNYADLNLKAVHSGTRGLSLNRNIGLMYATGDWRMFWDADCLMDARYFARLTAIAASIPDAALLYGSILSTTDGRAVFRAWPKEASSVSTFFKWRITTSVNCIWKNLPQNQGKILDEQFGIGAVYGSCEDLDFFLRIEGPSVYDPGLIVYHPNQDINDVPTSKLASYSYGFGAVCRKHAKGYGLIYLSLTIAKKLLQIMAFRVQVAKGLVQIRERLRGFSHFGRTGS